MFNCDCCGMCCMNLSASLLYSDLDRGDGICIYFDCDTYLCTIYSERPDKCNIDLTYDLYFKEKMTKEEYYNLNYEMCKRLKRRNHVWFSKEE